MCLLTRNLPGQIADLSVVDGSVENGCLFGKMSNKGSEIEFADKEFAWSDSRSLCGGWLFVVGRTHHDSSLSVAGGSGMSPQTSRPRHLRIGDKVRNVNV